LLHRPHGGASPTLRRPTPPSASGHGYCFGQGISSRARSTAIGIQGTCNGSVQTKKGNIIVAGQLHNGNIISGGSVTVTGSFKGGEIKAKDKIYIDGSFEGKLESNEIEVGPQTEGKGEIIYGEFISIARGAKIEAKVIHGKKRIDSEKRSSNGKIVAMPPPQAAEEPGVKEDK